MYYIPIDAQKAESLERKLARSKVYRSVDNFVDLYNTKTIDVLDNEVNKVAREIEATFQNIEIRNRRIIVKSKEEVSGDKALFVLEHLSVLARLQRVANDIVEDNYPLDTFMVFKEGDMGIIYITEDIEDLESILPYVGAERLNNAHSALNTNPFLIKHTYALDTNMIGFRVEDLINVDTSMLNTVGDIVADYIENYMKETEL